jgi:hypothetical protein
MRMKGTTRQPFPLRMIVLLSALVLLGSWTVVFAADSGNKLRRDTKSIAPSVLAERLTRDLVALGTRYQSARSAEQSELLSDIVTVATERRQLLASLMTDDPAEVLRVALPFNVRATVPAAARAIVEENSEAEGEIEILHEDFDSGSRNYYFLHSDGRRFSLHFAADPPIDLTTGTRIRVHGVRIDSMLALAGGNTSVQTVSPAPAQNTFGEQRTLVMLVNFSDNSLQPWSREQVNDAIFGTVNAFIKENSYGQTWVTGDVTNWMTIALSSTVCDTTTLASQAQQAAKAAGWVPSNYSRWIYAFPQNQCGFAGASIIGGTPSQSWLNGDISLRIAGHEYGHGLGLWHSHSMDCGDVPLGPTCTTSEYGDTLDIMGTAQTAHYDPFQKERLGWLTPLTVTESGTYTLDAYENAGANPLALKIFKSVDGTGAYTWYYVEVRKRIGFDNTLVYTGMTNGVAVRLGSGSSGNTSYLLDMTPNSGSNDWLDPTLAAGRSFTDADAGVTITTESITTTGAVVTVSLATPQAPPPASLTETVTSDQASYTRNQTVSITTTVTSGGSPVAGASVTFTITKASGAIVAANATTGSDGTALYKLRLKKQDPVGTYRVDALAKTSGASASASTQFAVQ